MAVKFESAAAAGHIITVTSFIFTQYKQKHVSMFCWAAEGSNTTIYTNTPNHQCTHGPCAMCAGLVNPVGNRMGMGRKLGSFILNILCWFGTI